MRCFLSQIPETCLLQACKRFNKKNKRIQEALDKFRYFPDKLCNFDKNNNSDIAYL